MHIKKAGTGKEPIPIHREPSGRFLRYFLVDETTSDRLFPKLRLIEDISVPIQRNDVKFPIPMVFGIIVIILPDLFERLFLVSFPVLSDQILLADTFKTGWNRGGFKVFPNEPLKKSPGLHHVDLRRKAEHIAVKKQHEIITNEISRLLLVPLIVGLSFFLDEFQTHQFIQDINQRRPAGHIRRGKNVTESGKPFRQRLKHFVDVGDL